MRFFGVGPVVVRRRTGVEFDSTPCLFAGVDMGVFSGLGWRTLRGRSAAADSMRSGSSLDGNATPWVQRHHQERALAVATEHRLVGLDDEQSVKPSWRARVRLSRLRFSRAARRYRSFATAPVRPSGAGRRTWPGRRPGR